MTQIGLIFGGRSVEHKVSVASARTIAKGLVQAGHSVVPLGIGPDGCWVGAELGGRALDGELDSLPPGGEATISTLGAVLESLGRGSTVDVLFPIVHGTWGEDGTLQGLCEMLGLPYVGANVMASALAMDKALSKQIFRSAGIPVADFEVVTREGFLDGRAGALKKLERLDLPLFVKPSVGGSSVGISKVERREELAAAIDEALRFDNKVVVERGIIGRELECAVLGYGKLEASSAIGEIVPGKSFYDYADKYIDDGAQLIAPAQLPEEVAHEIRRLARLSFAALGGNGMARVDFFLENEEGRATIYLNEINTLPGFTEISMYPRLWGLSGLPLPDLVDRLVKIAFEGHADRTRLDRGIKEWIVELERR